MEKDNKTKGKINNTKKVNKKKKVKKHRKLKKVLLVIFILLAIVVTYFIIQVNRNGGGMRGLVTTFIGSDIEQIKNLEDIYILCMGSSQNLTDTIMVLKYNPREQTASILSIPRDSFVGNSTENASPFDKINARYSLGAQAVIDCVNDLTGLNLKYYITVDTKALRDLVDTLGGVYYYVPMKMDYDDSSQDLYIHLKEGWQTLNGEQAEGLVRFRHNNDGTSYPSDYGDNDLGRMKTQRAFISEVLKQAMKPSNITKINQVMTIAQEEVESNIPWEVAKDYVAALMNFNTENLKTDTLPGTPRYMNEYSFFVVDKYQAKEKVNELFLTSTTTTETVDEYGNTISQTTTSSANEIDKEDIKLEVLNGTGSESKFEKALDQLDDEGYDIETKGTTNVTRKTVIINRKDTSKDIPNAIKSILCTGVTTTGEKKEDVDFTVIIGTDY